VIAVAMSGGVDSSVAAARLLESGCDVIGVTLSLHARADIHTGDACGGEDAIGRAKKVAEELGIPHHVIDGSREFEALVLAPAWEEYERGRTPSPCLLCNERVKFGLLLERARLLGADSIATGHYARIECDERGTPYLRRGVDTAKDQSYFLAGLSAEQLAATRFPLGKMRKSEVREKARALGLASRETKDSQDACLVGPGDNFAEALKSLFLASARQGEIVDEQGRVLGRHDGVHLYTIGQRKGLRVPSKERLWVRAIRAEDAAVVVTAEESRLCSTEFLARDFRWRGGLAPASPFRCEVQVRYRSAPAKATVELLEANAISVALDAPVRAITPGQAAVFYIGDKVIGRGWID
jgi:tRNA-uridine 2-sulfurtransferase